MTNIQEPLKLAKVKLLEANRNGYTNGNDALALINEAIAELEKCEPVAWMNSANGVVINNKKKRVYDYSLFDTPLYRRKDTV